MNIWASRSATPSSAELYPRTSFERNGLSQPASRSRRTCRGFLRGVLDRNRLWRPTLRNPLRSLRHTVPASCEIDSRGLRYDRVGIACLSPPSARPLLLANVADAERSPGLFSALPTVSRCGVAVGRRRDGHSRHAIRQATERAWRRRIRMRSGTRQRPPTRAAIFFEKWHALMESGRNASPPDGAAITWTGLPTRWPWRCGGRCQAGPFADA